SSVPTREVTLAGPKTPGSAGSPATPDTYAAADRSTRPAAAAYASAVTAVPRPGESHCATSYQSNYPPGRPLPAPAASPAGVSPAGASPAGVSPAGASPAGLSPAGRFPGRRSPGWPLPGPAACHAARPGAAPRARVRSDPAPRRPVPRPISPYAHYGATAIGPVSG